MSAPRRKEVRDALMEDWKKAYQVFCDDESSDDLHFESACIGWVVAKGYTVEDGYYFYMDLPEGLF